MYTDSFSLYDLRIELVAFRDGKCQTDGAKIGDYFEVRWENLFFPAGQGFSLYNLAAILPLLPAKQRETHGNDWMTTDTDISAVDVNCGGVFRITRLWKREFRHSETSGNSISASTWL